MQKDPLQLTGELVADKYEVGDAIGEGGFAVVYQARHTIWKRPVAIKFFSGLSRLPVQQRDDLARSFIQEGALLTELSTQTATIVQARDVGTFTSKDGHWMPYMVLEWLDGETLEDCIVRREQASEPPLGIDVGIALLTPIAEALDVAHRRGIAHRDVKPSNIFVVDTAAGEKQVVKLLDFGVAKMMSSQQEAHLAKTGEQITSFTPQYGAPEQFSRRHGATGPWTDVYALALVLVELASGQLALSGEDLVQLGFASSDPTFRPTPRRLNATVSDAVEAVMEKALAVSPTDRYPRARDFWDALLKALGREQNEFITAPVVESVRGEREIETLDPLSLAGTQISGEVNDEAAPPREASTTDGTVNLLSKTASPKKSNVTNLLKVGAVLAAAAGAFLFFTPNNALLGKKASISSLATDKVSSSPQKIIALHLTCPQGMTKVDAGQFFMGSDSRDARDNEKPAHNVSLESYCIDNTEVTTLAYKSCSTTGKCRRAGMEVDWPDITEEQRELFSQFCNGGQTDKSEHPINCVSHRMAREYCSSIGKRLPSEAEWEYATRGPDGRIYPWGDDEPTEKHLNACGSECEIWGSDHDSPMTALYEADDGYVGTAPVGSFPLGNSRFGPQDVVGNVWEWVSDWEDEYSSEPQVNPTGPNKGERKIIRGGAFNGSFSSWLRPSFRYAQAPTALSHGVGFRCAMTFPSD